jgi:hypothetical protein
MLVMRAIEGRAHPLGHLLSTQQALRFHHAAPLAECIHLGSIGFSHGLFFANRQLMILTPSFSPFFTRRLCSPIHRLTSRLMCQLALSHTRTRTLLPACASSSEHHERKRVSHPAHRSAIDEAPQPRPLVEFGQVQPV